MAGVRVFGRPSTDSIANDVLKSASLNANPSPANPQIVPSGELAAGYGRLLAACYEIKKAETDEERLAKVAETESFADRTLGILVEGAAGAPDLVPMQPPAPPPPPAMPTIAGAGSPVAPPPMGGGQPPTPPIPAVGA